MVYRAVVVGNPNLASSFPQVTISYPTAGLQEVSRSELRAGDVMYGPGHVALYIGGDKYINASQDCVKVITFSTGGGWATRFFRPEYN